MRIQRRHPKAKVEGPAIVVALLIKERLPFKFLPL